MSSQNKGVQAVLREKQPLALYVHCSPHCVSLMNQTACGSSRCAWCTEFGPQTWHSLLPVWKLQDLFLKKIAQSEAGSFRTLKPLCPTQWLQRMGPVQAVIGQYEVLLSLEEMAASGSSDICTTARGAFSEGSDYFVFFFVFATPWRYNWQYPCSTITNAVNRLRAMLPEVRSLFTQVESLVRFLLVVPCSSAETKKLHHESTSSEQCGHLPHPPRQTWSNWHKRDCQLFISAIDRRNVFVAFIVLLSLLNLI